jgi:putative spermidine/putrescine transport system ATP-binding protein
MSEQVTFDSVNKSFNGLPAVCDLNLTVEEGEFFTLLGPSGSGKTTSLRMLAGLESLTSGRILVGGKDVSRTVAEKRNIGLVFQNYALFPHMTAAENVAFPLKMQKVPKHDRDARVEKVLEMVGLQDFGGRHPAQMSGGQQQRVALARAFVFDPSILLMDEPLGALDRNLRDHMRVELKALQARIGATVLYVTHDQDEALAMSDRIGIMHQGLLQQVASPVEMYERPVNSFVAKFLGDSVCLPASRKHRASDTLLDIEGVSGPVTVCADGDTCRQDRGVFIVRPERVSLHTEEPRAVTNVARGRVETTVYLGSVLQVRMREEGGALIQAALAGHRGEAPPQGSEVWMSWSAEDSRFLDHVE